jgi:hypothetical protein
VLVLFGCLCASAAEVKLNNRVGLRNTGTAADSFVSGDCLCFEDANNLAPVNITGVAGAGDITDVGDCASGACFKTGGTGTELASDTNLKLQADKNNNGGGTNEVVLNDDGLPTNTRIETNDQSSMLFIDGSNNCIAINRATCSQVVHVNGGTLGGAQTAFQMEADISAGNYATVQQLLSTNGADGTPVRLGFTDGASGAMLAQLQAAHVGPTQGGYLEFRVRPNGEAASMLSAGRINNAGRWAIGHTGADYQLDVAAANTQLRFGTADADDGGFLVSTTSSQAIVSGGAAWNGTSWIAKATTASLMSAASGEVTLYANTSLTPGSSFTLTKAFAAKSNRTVEIPAQSGAAPTATEGHLYADDDDGNLYYYDGTAWRDLTQQDSGGDITAVGDCTSGNCFLSGGSGTKLDSDSDFIIEIDANNDGTNKLSVLDGAGTEILSATEAGVVALTSTAPQIDLIDSTASAKDLRIVVDGNKAHVYEVAGVAGDIVSLDLTNNRLGVGTASPETNMHVYENNTDTAAAIIIEQDGPGDTTIEFRGQEQFFVGVDNSDSDQFKIDYAALGLNDLIMLNKSGAVSTKGPIGTRNANLTLGAGATTFAVSSNVMTITGDAGSNTIATITGATNGQLLTLIFADALVTVTDDNTHVANSVDLSGTFTSADDTVLQLVFDGTSWYEISRSVN